jgi:shikimate dehydrogenase
VSAPARYAILGWPVGHSLSPAMQNAAFAALGIEASYLPLAVPPERLGEAVAAAHALGLQGLNVTVPHKSAVMPLLARVEPNARAIGAANTIVREGDDFVGLNTDAEGLARSLIEGGATLQDARVVVVGAGGAARAALVGLAQAGATKLTVAARRPEQAQALVNDLAQACGATQLAAGGLDASLQAVCADATLLVQASSATLDDGPAAEAFAGALPLAALPKDAVVCDLVYRPLQTAVLRAAKARGLHVVDGLGMLLHQGALAFERWTGRAAPLDAMRAALNLR